MIILQLRETYGNPCISTIRISTMIMIIAAVIDAAVYGTDEDFVTQHRGHVVWINRDINPQITGSWVGILHDVMTFRTELECLMIELI